MRCLSLPSALVLVLPALFVLLRASFSGSAQEPNRKASLPETRERTNGNTGGEQSRKDPTAFAHRGLVFGSPCTLWCTNNCCSQARNHCCQTPGACTLENPVTCASLSVSSRQRHDSQLRPSRLDPLPSHSKSPPPLDRSYPPPPPPARSYLLPPPPERSDPTLALGPTIPGYCAQVKFSGLCDRDVSGFWELGEEVWDGFAKRPLRGIASCAAFCRACEGCSFVSFSAAHRVCSWHSECLLTDLRRAQSGVDYNTTAVRPARPLSRARALHRPAAGSQPLLKLGIITLLSGGSMRCGLVHWCERAQVHASEGKQCPLTKLSDSCP